MFNFSCYVICIAALLKITEKNVFIFLSEEEEFVRSVNVSLEQAMVDLQLYRVVNCFWEKLFSKNYNFGNIDVDINFFVSSTYYYSPLHRIASVLQFIPIILQKEKKIIYLILVSCVVLMQNIEIVNGRSWKSHLFCSKIACLLFVSKSTSPSTVSRHACHMGIKSNFKVMVGILWWKEKSKYLEK